MFISRKILSLCIVIALVLSSYCIVPVFAAEAIKATPTQSTVLVDGTSVSFQAYNIDGYNYFKLRDLGKVLSGTSKQFEVGYDSVKKSVAIITGKSYTAVGGELSTVKDSAPQNAIKSQATVMINGAEANLTAYLIGGNNYFKLRDIAAEINFNVSYDSYAKTICIDSSSNYVAESGSAANGINPLVGAWYFEMADGGDTYSSYLIFNKDGSIVQFVGNKIATYTTAGSNIKVMDKTDGDINTYAYSLTSKNGKLLLNIEANEFGLMEKYNDVLSSSTSSVAGIWLSHNEIFKDTGDDNYFIFTKDGNVQIGIIMIGNYTVSDNTFSDNITDDGKMETTKYEIKVVNGITEMILTEASGDQTTLYKY